MHSIDAETKACLAHIPPEKRKAVVQHDAYRYLARHYGLQIVGAIASFTGQQSGPRALARLAAAMRGQGVRVIFTEPQFSPSEARALAEATGARLYTLHSDALTPQVSSYLALLRSNGQTLCQAFRQG